MKLKISIKVFLLSLFGVLSACNPEGKPINYGEDKCEYCRMSIVDNQFGCEIVTNKGKVFMFDAVECMVNYLDRNVEDESTIELMLTNTYDKPGSLTNAIECYYLKSTNMPSPMGMYLNPFYDEAKALKNQETNTGTIYKWHELRAEFATMN